MRRLSRAALWLPVLTVSALVLGLTTAQSQGSTPAASPPAGNPLALKAGPADAKHGEALTQTCQGCHGPMGHSKQEDKPSLGGQVPSYLTLQLAAFRAKLRPSPIMQAIASRLSDQDIVDLAAYYAQQTPREAWEANAALKCQGRADLLQRHRAAQRHRLRGVSRRKRARLGLLACGQHHPPIAQIHQRSPARVQGQPRFSCSLPQRHAHRHRADDRRRTQRRDGLPEQHGQRSVRRPSSAGTLQSRLRCSAVHG